MTTADPIRPDFQTPRTFGLLNVVYAAALMACGLCQNLVYAIPSLVRIGTVKVSASAPAPSLNSPGLAARLERLEAATTDPRSREVLATMRRREALDRDGPVAPLIDPERLGDPRLVGHLVLDLASGLILNLLLLASGVGLLLAKGWGRSIALGVAWMKIARLAVLAVSMTFVAAPAVSAMLASMDDGAGGAVMARSSRSLLVGFAWGMFALGSIYPAITIYFLRLPSVRAAFRSGSK